MEVPGDADLSTFLAKSPGGSRRVKTVASYSGKSSQSESLGLTAKPSSETGKLLVPDVKKPVTYLAPDWKKRREQYSIRERTLLRIYFSKWFYQGLDWQERELLLLLLESQKVSTSLLNEVIFEGDSFSTFVQENPKSELIKKIMNLNDSSLKRKTQPIKAICLVGASVLLRLEQQRETSLNQRGNLRLEHYDLLSLLYSEKDFLAVWKLRSFQSMRDRIFAKFDKASQTGKLGIKKPRIRGYTDGRGSSGDTRRTKMARQLDAWFWSDSNEKLWNEMFEEMDRLAST